MAETVSHFGNTGVGNKTSMEKIERNKNHQYIGAAYVID
jgi:hypothetical protein